MQGVPNTVYMAGSKECVRSNFLKECMKLVTKECVELAEKSVWSLPKSVDPERMHGVFEKTVSSLPTSVEPAKA